MPGIGSESSAMSGTNRPRVYFDANAMLEMIEKPGPVSDLLSSFWGGGEPPRDTIVTSELTLAEVLVRPIAENNIRRWGMYEGLVQNTKGLVVYPADREVMIEAEKLRARRQCSKLPDAILLASALLTSCVAMVTDDRRIKSSPDLAIVNFDVPSLTRLLTE